MRININTNSFRNIKKKNYVTVLEKVKTLKGD